MSTKIYTTAVHKPKENHGIFAYTVFRESKKPVEKTIQFECESRIELQLNALIQSITAVKSSSDLQEAILITDFALVKQILDGTAYEWERNDWVKDKDQEVPCSSLWQKLLDLVDEYNIGFELADKSDETIKILTKAVKDKGPKNTKSQGNGKILKISESKIPETMEELVESEKKETPKNDKVEKVTKSKKVPVTAQPVEKINISPEKEKNTLPETSVPEEMTEFSSPSIVEKRVKSSTVSNTVIGDSVLPQSVENVINVNSELKKQCEVLFQEIGLDLDTAVTLFLKHSLRKNGLTLDLKLKD